MVRGIFSCECSRTRDPAHGRRRPFGLALRGRVLIGIVLLIGSIGTARAEIEPGDLTLTVTRPTPTDQWLTSGIEPATTEQ